MNAFQWAAVVIPVIALHTFLFSLFCRDWLDTWFYSRSYGSKVRVDFFIGVVILTSLASDALLIIYGYCAFIKFLGDL